MRVEPLTIKQAYRAYLDSVLGSGELSLPTRQTLNLVPEADGGRDLPRALAALGASVRIDAVDAAFARAELALREAERLRTNDAPQARAYWLVAAHEAARLLAPRGRMVAVDPFDRRYRLASEFYALEIGRAHV